MNSTIKLTRLALAGLLALGFTACLPCLPATAQQDDAPSANGAIDPDLADAQPSVSDLAAPQPVADPAVEVTPLAPLMSTSPACCPGVQPMACGGVISAPIAAVACVPNTCGRHGGRIFRRCRRHKGNCR